MDFAQKMYGFRMGFQCVTTGFAWIPHEFHNDFATETWPRPRLVRMAQGFSQTLGISCGHGFLYLGQERSGSKMEIYDGQIWFIDGFMAMVNDSI